MVGAPEIFVDNPLCPTNKESFWNKTLLPYINQVQIDAESPALLLIEQITELYNETYFKYFNYPDFLTPYSGLIQIKKYAELQADVELLNRFSEITKLTKAVKQQLYKLLVEDFTYLD